MREIISAALAVALHELGHLIAAKMLGVCTRAFSLKPIGAALTFDFSAVSYSRELAVHAAGPTLGIISASVAYLLLGEASLRFAGISCVLSAINLLPITGLDGGGILRCALSLFLMPNTIEAACRAVSFVFLLLLWTGVLWIELRVGANLSLLAFVLFFMLRIS